jgi:hypothetical protein
MKGPTLNSAQDVNPTVFLAIPIVFLATSAGVAVTAP